MDASFELWCCYEYLCESYDRMLGGDRVIFTQTPVRALSQRNANDRRTELRSMTGGTAGKNEANRLSYEEVARIAVRSQFLRHFGPVGRQKETLWGYVDELGRVAVRPRDYSTNPCGEIAL